MNFYDNVIVVDADGVFLNFEHAYTLWMHDNGYGAPLNDNEYLDRRYAIDKKEADLLYQMFRESATLSRLPPLRDAIKYIRKLHEEHGFVFHCITAIADIPAVREARWKNIHNLFGITPFERLTLCERSANKGFHLEKYANTGCYWIEDLPRNALTGHELGLTSLLMHHDYNKDFYHKDIKRVHNWKEIYETIVG